MNRREKRAAKKERRQNNIEYKSKARYAFGWTDPREVYVTATAPSKAVLWA